MLCYCYTEKGSLYFFCGTVYIRMCVCMCMFVVENCAKTSKETSSSFAVVIIVFVVYIQFVFVVVLDIL